LDAREHRAKARELREKMKTAHDPSVRAHLLMSDEYDWLAEQAEKRERESKKP
jgi:hypothetical protein